MQFGPFGSLVQIEPGSEGYVLLRAGLIQTSGDYFYSGSGLLLYEQSCEIMLLFQTNRRFGRSSGRVRAHSPLPPGESPGVSGMMAMSSLLLQNKVFDPLVSFHPCLGV